MSPKSVNDRRGDGGAEGLARGVAEAIAWGADRYLGVPLAKPLPFATVALRLARVRRRAQMRRLTFACVSCAAAAVVLGFWVRPKLDARQTQALTYTVDGAAPPTGGSLTAEISTGPTLSFSDGTRVQLAPQAHGRVVDLNRHGARIALDDGRANVEVAHRPGAQWLFEAGPFLITVHGTAFSLGWNARSARLEVQMRSGVVSVTGPVSGGEIFLRAGQTLSLSLHGDDSPKPAPDRPESPFEAPPAAGLAATRANAARETAGRALVKLPSSLDWTAKLAEGEAAAIVADAKRRGISQVLTSSSSEDIAALADAARFERNDGLARRALLAQRQRFPGTGRAAEASFLLGRIDDRPDASSTRALAWYDRYLGEAPAGSYVSEALGRKMMVLERSGRQGEATRIAKDYLQRFPGGTYAHAAQALVHVP
jgi:hypothetical protein